MISISCADIECDHSSCPLLPLTSYDHKQAPTELPANHAPSISTQVSAVAQRTGFHSSYWDNGYSVSALLHLYLMSRHQTDTKSPKPLPPDFKKYDWYWETVDAERKDKEKRRLEKLLAKVKSRP